MRKPKVHWSKKLSSVPKKLPTQGAIRIRPVSFHMDKLVDKYVVTGGGHKAVITGSRRSAKTVAHARIRVVEKRRLRKRK